MTRMLQTLAAAIVSLAAVTIPFRLAAQEQTGNFRRYKLIDIGTFGGPESYIVPFDTLGSPNQINGRGAAVGGSATSIPTTAVSNGFICGGVSGAVPFVNHAFEWQSGVIKNLPSLGGPGHCSVATGVNAYAEVAGQAEIGRVDPVLGIDELRAVVWKNGHITNLGTFGGAHSLATTINNRGQVVGTALNKIPDPFSFIDFMLAGSSNGTQARAFLWEGGPLQDLGTLGGNDASANLVNDRGQIAGTSYTNDRANSTTGLPTFHPFLWDHGTMTDLGTLGGTFSAVNALNNRGEVVGLSSLEDDQVFHAFLWTPSEGLQDLQTLGGDFAEATEINEAGEVVGWSFTPGDRATHAFLWRKGELTDLGTVGSDPCSQDAAINSAGQIVGKSQGSDCSTPLHAFLWEKGGPMVDLNALIPAGSSLHLVWGLAINNHGEVTGIGLPSGCAPEGFLTCGHAFVLIPVCADGNEGCADAPLDPSVVAQSRGASGVVPKPVTAEELATFKERLARMAGRNRRFGLWPTRQFQPSHE
jgi:probable HAF family extracellular repeat protein